MTLKEFLKSESIKLSYQEQSLFGNMVVARAKKNGVPYGHKTESKWGGKLTFQVNDYPDNFIPDIKKVYTQLQFILKSRTKNTS